MTKYIAIPFIYLLAWLPFPVLYGVAFIVYLLLYYIVGYRKKVVLVNLRNAFPEKTNKEINAICKKYYRYLCDLFLETFKTLSFTKEEMLHHCYFNRQAKELFDRYAAENKSVILVLGHFGNWEWAGNTFSIVCNQQLYVIYHPIGNQFFDEMMYNMRTKFGTKLIAMKNTFREMLAAKKDVTITAFIADQTPSSVNAYWTTFLNQDTPVFWGTEVISRKLDRPVVYITVKKIKRGYYELCAEVLHEHPAQTGEGVISELHTKRLEQDIIAQPETWLWSHRRWKHKKPEPQPAG
ncbi:MAG: lysophospholipid acyltransferase family protein [Taibaiella sp.]|nr:lysophospholipid acyltransferase family protein [Taibaiella sp.]